MIGVVDEATGERRLKLLPMVSTTHAQLECKPNSGDGRIWTGCHTPRSTPTTNVQLVIMVVHNRRTLRKPGRSLLNLIFARIVVGVNQMVVLG